MAHQISRNNRAERIHPELTNGEKAVATLASIAGPTTFTAITSALFSIANPLTGAVFGATSAATSLIANEICDYTRCAADNMLLKVVQCGLSTIISMAAAWAICNAIGIPITFAAASLLTAASLAVSFSVAAVAGSTFFCCFSYIFLTGAGYRRGESAFYDGVRDILESDTVRSIYNIFVNILFTPIDPNRIFETAVITTNAWSRSTSTCPR